MTVRIGNGCGFWGDNLDAPALLARAGRLDYLTLEYLAELTMSILARQKERDGASGYASDFIGVIASLVPIMHDQPRLKIITNAGGMNPRACATRVKPILVNADLSRRIGIVSGDDLLPRLDELLSRGHPFTNLDTGAALSTIRDRVVSANAYLGAAPIAQALEQGADIVITGRVADASLTVGPCMHEFGWRWDQWQRLNAATVAGHLIECGAQATGGLWCNYEDAPKLADVGYPLIAIDADGSFILTKPPETGGAVNRETTIEQLLYEVGDPAAYMTPDVVADFTTVSIEDLGHERVRVTSGPGKPATPTYKVSIAYRNGFTASGTLVYFGIDAVAKARLAGSLILDRLKRINNLPEHHNIECLGTGACVPGVIANAVDPIEVVLRVTVHDRYKEVVERFTKEFAPLVTSGPPGATGYTSGRPVVRETFAYWPALIAKEAVVPQVEMMP